jgi:FkbM family methyltransferase
MVFPNLFPGLATNLIQWFRKHQHEADFMIFKQLASFPGLVIDVGANRGHSAISVLRHTRRMHVFSIEPNRTHRWSLLLIGLLHPFRFRFRLIAAGETFSKMRLYVPGKRGSVVSASASLDPSELDKEYVHKRLLNRGVDTRSESDIRCLSVKVVPLDQLNLRPDLIKIDVEGYEFQTLKGLMETIKRFLPVLLMEINNSHLWLKLLQDIGYTIFYFDADSQKLLPHDGKQKTLNVFCLHDSNHSIISQALWSRVQRLPGSMNNIFTAT